MRSFPSAMGGAVSLLYDKVEVQVATVPFPYNVVERPPKTKTNEFMRDWLIYEKPSMPSKTIDRCNDGEGWHCWRTITDTMGGGVHALKACTLPSGSSLLVSLNGSSRRLTITKSAGTTDFADVRLADEHVSNPLLACTCTPDGSPLCVVKANREEATPLRVWSLPIGTDGQIQRDGRGSPDGSPGGSPGGNHQLVGECLNSFGENDNAHSGRPVWACLACVTLTDGTVCALTGSHNRRADGMLWLWDVLDPSDTVLDKILGRGEWVKGFELTSSIAPYEDPTHGTACVVAGGSGLLVCKIARKPHSRVLYQLGGDGVCGAWDGADDDDTGKTRVVATHVMADGNVYAVSSSDGKLDDESPMHVWHLNERWCLHVLRGHKDSVSAIELVTLPDGALRAISGSLDLTLRLWDPLAGTCLRVCDQETRHHDYVTGVACFTLENGAVRVASASFDSTLKVWPLTEDKEPPDSRPPSPPKLTKLSSVMGNASAVMGKSKQRIAKFASSADAIVKYIPVERAGGTPRREGSAADKYASATPPTTDKEATVLAKEGGEEERQPIGGWVDQPLTPDPLPVSRPGTADASAVPSWSRPGTGTAPAEDDGKGLDLVDAMEEAALDDAAAKIQAVVRGKAGRNGAGAAAYSVVRMHRVLRLVK